MKQNEAFYPVDVAFFEADTQVLEAQDLAQLIEPFALASITLRPLVGG